MVDLNILVFTFFCLIELWHVFFAEIGGKYLSDSTSGNLSTVFDIGGVFGGILAGYISDRMRARAITAASFMYFSIPALFVYHVFSSVSLWLNLVLMFVAGMFVNGPYALITTAVSADLGTHKSLKGNSKALATVTAIIDGTVSVGAHTLEHVELDSQHAPLSSTRVLESVSTRVDSHRNCGIHASTCVVRSCEVRSSACIVVHLVISFTIVLRVISHNSIAPTDLNI